MKPKYRVSNRHDIKSRAATFETSLTIVEQVSQKDNLLKKHKL